MCRQGSVYRDKTKDKKQSFYWHTPLFLTFESVYKAFIVDVTAGLLISKGSFIDALAPKQWTAP